jgi:hypothetical protein
MTIPAFAPGGSGTVLVPSEVTVRLKPGPYNTVGAKD